MRHRRRSLQPFKKSVKKSGTFLDNVGQGSNALNMVVLETSGGARSTDGDEQTIQSASTTSETCQTGDECKFINLAIQCGPRADTGNAVDRTGWVEWAFVCVRENETQVPATQLGTLTLGNICTNMYRGECIYTGAFPIGNAQPANVINLELIICISHIQQTLGFLRCVCQLI